MTKSAEYYFGLLYSIAGILAAFVISIVPGAVLAGSLTLTDNTPVDHILEHMTVVPSTKDHRHHRRLVITNKTDSPAIRRLSTKVLNPLSFEFYIDDKSKNTLVFNSRYPYSPLTTRASQGRVITSRPIVIDPGSSVSVDAYFDWPPEDIFPITFAPEQTFDAARTRASYLHGWYFGTAIVLLAFFIAFSILLSSSPARFYALYFLALTCLTFHSYGYAEQFFQGDLRQYYFSLFRLLQAAIMLSYLLFAISFLHARQRYPLLYRITIIYLLLMGPLILIEVLTYNEYYVLIVNAMALGFLSLGVATTFIALRDKLDGALLFASGYVVLLINGVVNYVASHNSFAQFNDTVDALTLCLQTTDAFIFAAAIVKQTHALRDERDDALIAKLAATEEKLQISERLRDANVERDRARTLAESHRARLAATSHDLRQPLTSLQLAVQQAEVESDLQEKLNVGLDYLNTILGENLDKTLPDTDKRDNFGEDHHVEQAESVPLQMILDNIHRMFIAEAEAKGIELLIAPTSLVTRAPTIVVIRIISNLVANAIKFTSQGKVLVGARRRRNQITLQVWDTGSGLDEQTVKRIVKPYERANDNEKGYGLGLSIVHKLAAQHDLKLEIISRPGVGSVFSVSGLIRDNNGLKTYR